MKKVLIITYYWPPAGGIAVQRIVKFCKYLPSFEWEPIILTVKDGNFENIDNTIGKDVSGVKKVYKARSIEPHSVYNFIQNIFGNNSTKESSSSDNTPGKQSKLSRLADLIRLNFFIPDARIGWLPAAYKEGINIIKKESPDIILSTAPPYTTHLVARKLKLYSGLPWIADYRDPWLENINYNTMPRLALVKYLNRKLEQKVLKEADRITVVGPSFRELYIKKLPADRHQDCHVIPNGFDADDISSPKDRTADKFYITYFGTTYPAVLQDVFFDAIKDLVAKNDRIQDNLAMRFIGKITTGFADKIGELLPGIRTEYIDHLPFKEAIQQLYQPQLLVLFIGKVPHNELIITGKIFDYLPTNNPILAIGPIDGDAAQILNVTQTGKMYGYEDANQIADYIYTNYKNWQSGSLKIESTNIDSFTRKRSAKMLAELLNDTVNKKILD